MEILIAEDNRVNRIVAMKLAERLGYRPDSGHGRAGPKADYLRPDGRGS